MLSCCWGGDGRTELGTGLSSQTSTVAGKGLCYTHPWGQEGKAIGVWCAALGGTEMQTPGNYADSA